LTPPAPPGPEPGQRRARWLQATRIIASRYPPVDLFERVSSDPGVWDALVAAEMLVNPRIRDEVGEIHLVLPWERVSGPGATYVMAAFTHLNPKGSRFSDGTYGVYYAGREFETALRETAYHFGRIAADSRDAMRYEDMRVLVSRIDARFHDLETLPRAAQARLLDPDSYARAHPSAPCCAKPAAMVWSIGVCAIVAAAAWPSSGRKRSGCRCRRSTSSTTTTASG
jgi:hypothetical protein